MNIQLKIACLASILLATVLTQELMAQNEYYHTLKLSKYISPVAEQFAPRNAAEKDTIKSILKHYGYDPAVASTNPFLNDLIAPGSLSSTAGVTENIFDIKDKVSSIGGFNVATIADGLAKFLVNRAKQELSMAFFDEFKDELNEYEELRIIFPKTHGMLNAIGDQIYNFSGYINMLREAFQLDLQNMIPNLRQLLDDDKLRSYLNTNPTVDFILRNALLIAEGLQNGNHPGDILSDVKDENINNTTVKNLSPGLQLLDLFSQSLKSNLEDQYWVSSDSLKLLFKKEVTFKIYLALIYQNGKDIKFLKKDGINTISFGSILTGINTNFTTNVVPLRDYIKQLIAKAEKIDRNLKTINQLDRKEGTKSTYSDHYAFYISAVELIEFGPAILDLPALVGNTYFDNAKFDKFISIAYDIGGLYLDVKEQNYFGAVMGLSNVLDKSIPRYRDDLERAVKKVKVWTEEIDELENSKLASKLGDIVRYASSQDQGIKMDELIDALDKLKADISSQAKKRLAKEKLEALLQDTNGELAGLNNDLMDRYGDLIAKLMKYGNLAASIAKAESSDEVEKIIESIALPAGSARIKRESKENFSLNAYLGMLAGGQDLPGEGNTGGFKPYTALSAPIGLAYSWGGINSEDGDGGNSFTIFVPLIDVGALATFRFDDDSTAIASNVELKNIFAPGAFFYWGFKRVPLSLGIGGQLGPRLHDISEGVTSEYDDYYIRWGATLAVDIPLINFYTKPK